jgi:hypothetical protein
MLFKSRSMLRLLVIRLAFAFDMLYVTIAFMFTLSIFGLDWRCVIAAWQLARGLDLQLGDARCVYGHGYSGDSNGGNHWRVLSRIFQGHRPGQGDWISATRQTAEYIFM